jgi:uncharacterized protein YlxW (UPF0749 family)
MTTPPAAGGPTGWRRLLQRRPIRSEVLIALLAGLLGFALVVQVRTTQKSSGLASARQEDLVQLLDGLTARSQRLQEEIAELQAARDQLSSGTDRDAAALEQARRRADALAILAGSAPARGPGLVIVIDDPGHAVRAEVLLDALQELRDAGAEAMMINSLRIGASSYVRDVEGGIELDGTQLKQPYTFTVVGESSTMDQALRIPGGVVDVVEDTGARITIRTSTALVIDALRPVSTPRYARPAPTG